MMFKLLALCSGLDSVMEQLEDLIYYSTPRSKAPSPEAEHTDFIMYRSQTVSHRRGLMSQWPIHEAQ